MNEADTFRLTAIDKRLAEVRHRQPSCAFVLDDWFGQPKGKESLVVLWPRTRQGRELLKQSRGRFGADGGQLSPREFFEQRIERQKTTPDDHVAWTHEQCDREARHLFGLACQTFNETAP